MAEQSGLVGHGSKLGFYSGYDGNSREDFLKCPSNVILFPFLRIILASLHRIMEKGGGKNESREIS